MSGAIGGKTSGCLILLSIFLLLGWPGARVESQTPKTYVGSQACRDCHEEEYQSYSAHAKKARSYASIARMRKGLTEAEFWGCFECHTTGHGRPGGFRSEEETPHLKDAGCEVCHGPGSLHVETLEARDINGQLTLDDCVGCHSAERVQAFGFTPLTHGGAH